MTHDKLHFTKHLHVHSQKKTLSNTLTLANKQIKQQQQQPQGVIVWCVLKL